MVRPVVLVLDDVHLLHNRAGQAAIAVLAAVPGTRILVLGDMGELGPAASKLHAEVGACAKAAGIDALYGLGPLSVQAVKAFGAGARHCASLEEIVRSIEPELGPQVSVLVKGSRYMQMERVVAALAAEPASASGTGV